MTLREYVDQVMPVVAPERNRRTCWMHRTAAEALAAWLGREPELSDMSPQLVESFRKVDALNAGRVRSVMATHDPVRFRPRRRRDAQPANAPPSQAGVYLLNVYERYEGTALRSRRPNSKRLYRTTLKMFDRFLERHATIDDLNDETVARFAAWRLGKGLSKHSVNKDLFNLLALWRWCCRKGIVELWPDVELEIPPRRQPVAWTEAEIKRLYQTVANLDGYVGIIPAAKFWTALLLVCWDSGERIGGVIGLDWANVDLDRGWVRFVAEDRKGARDDSAVRISDETIDALRKLRERQEPGEPAVFPLPFAHSSLWGHFTRILKRAGLPTDAKSKFHRIRKTVASYAEAAGANATAMLRHSKREVTEAYLDPRIVKQQQPADVLFRLSAAGGAK